MSLHSQKLLLTHFCRQNVASQIYALLSSNPPECQVWGKGGGDQANLGNAKILRAYGQVTPPLIVLVTLRIKHVISSKLLYTSPHPETIHPIRPSTYSSRCALRLRQHFLRTQVYVIYESFFQFLVTLILSEQRKIPL